MGWFTFLKSSPMISKKNIYIYHPDNLVYFAPSFMLFSKKKKGHLAELFYLFPSFLLVSKKKLHLETAAKERGVWVGMLGVLEGWNFLGGHRLLLLPPSCGPDCYVPRNNIIVTFYPNGCSQFENPQAPDFEKTASAFSYFSTLSLPILIAFKS